MKVLLSALLLFAFSGFAGDLDAWIPTLKVIEMPGYSVCYDSRMNSPRFVVGKIGPAYMGTTTRESLTFYGQDSTADPKLYRGSGLQLGHCWAASYAKRSYSWMLASFSMLNVMPQYQALNCVDWNELERMLLKEASNKELIIVTGPIFNTPSPKTMGVGTIGIPDACFKIAYAADEKPRAWIMPNISDAPNLKLESYLVSISEVERRTGLVFKH
jgi:DNA/RNA endonuclease G (NUC1)